MIKSYLFYENRSRSLYLLNFKAHSFSFQKHYPNIFFGKAYQNAMQVNLGVYEMKMPISIVQNFCNKLREKFFNSIFKIYCIKLIPNWYNIVDISTSGFRFDFLIQWPVKLELILIKKKKKKKCQIFLWIFSKLFTLRMDPADALSFASL